jgi:hypothetical protein
MEVTSIEYHKKLVKLLKLATCHTVPTFTVLYKYQSWRDGFKPYHHSKLFQTIPSHTAQGMQPSSQPVNVILYIRLIYHWHYPPPPPHCLPSTLSLFPLSLPIIISPFPSSCSVLPSSLSSLLPFSPPVLSFRSLLPFSPPVLSSSYSEFLSILTLFPFSFLFPLYLPPSHVFSHPFFYPIIKFSLCSYFPYSF